MHQQHLIVGLRCLIFLSFLCSINTVPLRGNLVRFYPISRKQYEAILSLTDGRPVISEGRLISSGFPSLGQIRTSLSSDLSAGIRSILKYTGLYPGDKQSDPDGYPLCVINTSDLDKDTDMDKDPDKNEEDGDDCKHPRPRPSPQWYPKYSEKYEQDLAQWEYDRYRCGWRRMRSASDSKAELKSDYETETYYHGYPHGPPHHHHPDEGTDELPDHHKKPVVSCIVIVKKKKDDKRTLERNDNNRKTIGADVENVESNDNQHKILKVKTSETLPSSLQDSLEKITVQGTEEEATSNHQHLLDARPQIFSIPPPQAVQPIPYPVPFFNYPYFPFAFNNDDLGRFRFFTPPQAYPMIQASPFGTQRKTKDEEEDGDEDENEAKEEGRSFSSSDEDEEDSPLENHNDYYDTVYKQLYGYPHYGHVPHPYLRNGGECTEHRSTDRSSSRRDDYDPSEGGAEESEEEEEIEEESE